MGLDSYLQAHKFVWSDYEHPENDVKTSKKIKKDLDISDKLPIGRVSEVTFELLYLRKCNAVHQFFVKNVQDGIDECQKADVDIEHLETLLGLIKNILGAEDKVATAQSLLPTQDGFFFGSTDYDEWYFKDLEKTEKVLTEFLAHKDELKDIYVTYQSSW
jgi:hypothetical protein